MTMTATDPAALARYARDAGTSDEARTPEGGLRAPWAALAARLAALPPADLARRIDQAQRDLRDLGPPDPHGSDGPQAEVLDPIPLVIEDAAWDELAVALTQRARLMDAIVADCYGPQRLLREGLLAPEAVLTHPNFLRPLHYLRPQGGRWLRAYAADLVRTADGRWLCLADRGQSPSGDGLALQARLASKRILPEAYRELQVRRLAPYFVALRRTLTALAPRGNDNPRIALLTPGPYSLAHGEHAFLARYLGYPLVEGGDLVVREDTVFLKTLAGLHPIDVLLRRQDDDFCDPLELRNDSTLGIPGLVQATRHGRVALLNPLGSGLCENRALQPALPRLCRALLGEELALPSPQSWWCGDALAVVEARLDQVALLPVHPQGQPVVPSQLTAAARAELLARVRAHPHAWIARELLTSATIPSWADGHLRPMGYTLRTFVLAHGDALHVLPGGRCTLDRTLGGGQKDVWVLARERVEEVSLLEAPHVPLELRRGSIELPSRVADNLFWIGRYSERAECAVRIARAIAQRLGEEPRSALGREREALVAMAIRAGLAGAAEAGAHARDPEGVLERLLTTEGHGLPGVLGSLRHAALAVRDRISNDTARIVARLDLGQDLTAVLRGDADALEALLNALAALAGMATENTTRGPGWRFLDSGRRLERALLATEVLREPFATAAGADAAAVPVLLEIADSAITYRSRYLASLQPHAVLDLLLTDDSNPRALLYQLDCLTVHLAALPRDQALPTQAEKLALGARTWVRLVDPQDLVREDEQGGRPALIHLLDHLGSDLGLLSDAITAQWLSHTTGPTVLPTWSG